MRIIQRTFLWAGNSEKKKWALVAWNKMCKPKQQGGLNLLDPSTINRACGAKLWWKWLKEPKLPWARHWKEKYAAMHSIQHLIRMQENRKGSPIWNLARKNQHIIRRIASGKFVMEKLPFFGRIPGNNSPSWKGLSLQVFKEITRNLGE